MEFRRGTYVGEEPEARRTKVVEQKYVSVSTSLQDDWKVSSSDFAAN